MPPWLKSLPFGYFALVMATGIIAVACDQQSLKLPAQALYIIASVAYVVLIALLVLRIARYPRLVLADLTHHATGFTFLTTVAATNVLGAASILVHDWWGLAETLWWVSLPLLAVGMYVPLTAIILRRDTPSLSTGINGTWFLLTVAVESVAVLAALLLGHHPQDLRAFVAVAAFGLGLFLYIVVVTMIFLRWTFYRLDPDEMLAPAWIAPGAAAIATLAGTSLLALAPQVERLSSLAPFLEGITILAWATATFWFPIMVAIGAWRHVVRHVPLKYDPSYWAMVFPLGMYAAATYHLLDVEQVPHLWSLPKVALAFAAAAWLAAMAGLVRKLMVGLRREAGSQHIM